MLALLQQGKPVMAMKRTGSDVKGVEKVFSCYTGDHQSLFKKIKWVEADLMDVTSIEEIIDGIDTVYHCAGLISFDEKDREQLLKTNRDGTANLVNVCLAKNTRRFCHVSSVAALQNPDVKEKVNESVLWKSSPNESSYALSKYLGEQEVWRASEEGLKAVIVNPGIIFGPGPWNRGSGRLFELCRKGSRYYTEGVTGYIDAVDVAAIMIALTEAEKFSERFILVENNYSFREVFNMIHAGFNKPLPSVRAGRGLLMTARFFSWLLPLKEKVTHSTMDAALKKTFFSNQKVTQALQYRFRPLSDCISFICKSCPH